MCMYLASMSRPIVRPIALCRLSSLLGLPLCLLFLVYPARLVRTLRDIMFLKVSPLQRRALHLFVFEGASYRLFFCKRCSHSVVSGLKSTFALLSCSGLFPDLVSM